MAIQNNQLLSGLNALPVNVIPAQLFLEIKDPTAANYNTIPYKNFQVGSFWLNTSNQNLWYLANIQNSPKVQGNWIKLSSAVAAETLTGNSGGAISPDSSFNINILGDGITTNIVGNPATHTLTVSLIGAGTGTVTSISSTVGLTLVPNPITTTGTIDLTVPVIVANGGTGATTLTGVLIGHGTSAVTGNAVTQHDVLIGGASNAITSLAPSAASGIPLISQGVAADPIFGTASVPGGGTGATTLTGVLIGNGTSPITGNPVTQFNVLVGGASNAITSITPSGVSGIPLISDGAAANPMFGTAVVSGGGTGDTSFTVYAPICGGITTTGPLQSAGSGIATSGFVLTSTGAASLPTWQAAPSGSGTVTSISSTTGLTLSPNPITTTGSIDLTVPVVVANGGTGATTLTGILIGHGTGAVTGNAVTNHSVLIGGASNAVTSATVGTNGQVLVGSTAADPAFATLGSSDGSIAYTTGAASLSIQVALVTPTTLPAFVATRTGNVTNATGDGTSYIVVYNSVSGGGGYDQTSSFNTSTGVFTAPYTGIYHFDAQAYVTGLTSTAWTGMQFSINNSIVTGVPGFLINPGKTFDSSNRIGVTASGDMMLPAGTTVWATLIVSGSTKTIGVQASSQFSGHMVR